jgi:hypothetical protein
MYGVSWEGGGVMGGMDCLFSTEYNISWKCTINKANVNFSSFVTDYLAAIPRSFSIQEMCTFFVDLNPLVDSSFNHCKKQTIVY